VTQDERSPEPSPAPETQPPASPSPQHDTSSDPAPDVPVEATTAPQAGEAPPPEPASHADAPPPAPDAQPEQTAAGEGEAAKLPGRGDIVEATVRRLAPFGAFVRLADGRKGLIHISQVADVFVEDIKQHVQIGQTVRARITAVLEDGKVDLSIKKAKPRPKPERPPKPKRQRRPEHDRAEPRPPKPAEQFHVNPLADALADVEKKLK